METVTIKMKENSKFEELQSGIKIRDERIEELEEYAEGHASTSRKLQDEVELFNNKIRVMDKKIKELQTYADNRNNRANVLKKELRIIRTEAKLAENCQKTIEEESKKKLDEERKRCQFWEKTARRYGDSEKYYRTELEKAHTLIGRIVHQYSEKWDQVNLSPYFPTDNMWRKRTGNNPSGEKK